MFIDVIKVFFETLLNVEIAEIFSAPIALFLALILIFLTFSFFISNANKRIFIITICFIVSCFTVFMIAKTYGFITLPISFGG